MEKLKLTTIFCCVTLAVSCVVFVATSCSQTGEQVVSDRALQESYEELYLSANSQQELVASLIEFEVANPAHFKSKLDLAQWYFSQANHVLSWQYLQRALSLADEAGFGMEFEDSATDGDDSTLISNQISQMNIPDGLTDIDLELLHRLLGYLCLFRDDINGAEKYGKTSLALTDYHCSRLGNTDEGLVVPSLYLMAQVLFSMAEAEDFIQEETIENALEYYDRAYKLNPQGLASMHLLGYGKLLVRVQRTNEAEAMVEEFFRRNAVTLDTILVAQEIYAATNNDYKEKICSFLGEDYVLGLLGLDDESPVTGENWISEYKKLVDMREENKISKTNSGHSVVVPGESDYQEEKFFGETYCEAALRYKEGRIVKGDLDSLVGLEPYFISSPSYYWLLWTVAKDLGNGEAFIPALKKTIALNPSGVFARAARQEIQNLVATQVSDEKENHSLLDSILF